METYIPGTKHLVFDWYGQSYELLEDIPLEKQPDTGSVFDTCRDPEEYYAHPISCEAQCIPVDARSKSGANDGEVIYTACFSATMDEYDVAQHPPDFLKFLDGVIITGDDI